MPHHQSTPNHPVGGSGYPGSGMAPGFVPGRMDRRADGMMVHHGMQPAMGMPHPHAWIPGPQPPVHPAHMSQPRNGTPGGVPDGHGNMNMPATVSSYDSTCSYSSAVPSPSGGHLSPKHDYSSARMSRFSTVPSFDSTTRQHSKSDDDQSLTTERSVPLKKRKTISSHPHPNAATSQDPAHVSPVTMHVTPNTTMQDETSSTSGTPHTSPSNSTSVVSGEKSGEHIEPNAAAILHTPIQKKKDSYPPPLHFVIPKFPTLLHSLLTESEYAGKVVQWLAHGKAWRIVRWDALRRQVLPSLFPQLCEEDKSSSPGSSCSSAGSIDAFLWHLTAWGFEEITDGDDAGAYSHELFRKDEPERCQEMTFASSEERDPPVSKEHSDAAKHTRSILRVPSLATLKNPSVDSSGLPERNAVEGNADANKSTVTATRDFSNMPVHTMSTVTSATTEGRPVFVNAENDRWKGGGVRVLHGMPPYSPIRIRSSRGGSRMVSRPSTEKVHRHGFPVSTRGRRRVGVANRSMDESALSLAASATGNAEVPLKMLEKEQAAEETPPKEEKESTTTEEPAGSLGPVPVGETTPPPRSVLKRRLPLSRETSKSSGVEKTDGEQDHAIKPSLSNSSSGSSATTESSSGSTTV